MSRYIKATSVALYFFCSVSVTFSQDLLINAQGDTLNVNIVEIDEENIHYSMPFSEDIYQYSVQKAKSYSQGYFVDGSNNVSANKPDNPEQNSSPYSNYTTLRAHVHAGWSTMLGQISEGSTDQMTAYSEQLRSGLNYSAGLDVFLHKHFGVGGQLTGFSSTAKRDDFSYYDPEEEVTITGDASDNFNFRSLDIKLIGRFSFQDHRFTVFAYIAGSRVWFTSNSERLEVAFKIKSNALGGSAGLGLDFKVTESFAIGIQASALTARLTDYEFQTDSGAAIASFDEVDDDISRLDLSFGLRWYF